MTRKHYQMAANRIRAYANDHGLDKLDASLAVLIEIFRDDNPRFDAARFVQACDPSAPTRGRK